MGRFGMVKVPVPSLAPAIGSCSCPADKVAVVHPDAFGKLELPGQAGADEAEHHAAISPVIVQHALGQHRPKVPPSR